MSETEVTTESQVVDTDNLDTFADDFFGRKSEAPAQTKAPVEQDTNETTDDVTSEAQEDTTDTPDPELEDEFVEPAPKKKTVQDRIDELVKQREDIKREADDRVEKLRKEFEDRIAALAPKAPEPKANTTGEPSPLDITDDGDEKYPLGEFDPQYIKDLTRYTLQQAAAEERGKIEAEKKVQEQHSARRALTDDWNQRVETSKADYPDFNEKGKALLDGFKNLEPSYADYMGSVLMSMDKGPDVLYYLSNHPEEATKIVNSGAQKATLALGRIEAKFLEADAQKQLAKPKISKAPPPPTERARGTNGAFMSVAGDTDDLDQFESAFFAKKK